VSLAVDLQQHGSGMGTGTVSQLGVGDDGVGFPISREIGEHDLFDSEAAATEVRGPVLERA
jgi:hypothetical protein